MKNQDIKFMFRNKGKPLSTHEKVEQHDIEKHQAPRIVFCKNNKEYSYLKHRRRIRSFVKQDKAKEILDRVNESNSYSYELYPDPPPQSKKRTATDMIDVGDDVE